MDTTAVCLSVSVFPDSAVVEDQQPARPMEGSGGAVEGSADDHAGRPA